MVHVGWGRMKGERMKRVAGWDLYWDMSYRTLMTKVSQFIKLFR